MNVLLFDPLGCMVEFGVRCKAAGHTVKHWIKNPDSTVGEGILTRVTLWEDHMDWADIIVCGDNAYHMASLEKYHDAGYPIFGPNQLSARLELDRKFGLHILEQAGLDMMPFTEFSTYDEAIEFVKANPKRYVSKPNGDQDKALSYVSKSAADMVFMLELWKSKGDPKGKFILQEFVAGREVAVGGWMGAEGFLKPIMENFEHKKLMSGNYGPNTGEQGTCLKYTESSKLFDETLGLFEDYLRLIGHRGYVDLAFIIDEEGKARPLEWTTRPGWPLFNIQLFLHKGDPVQWMKDALDGKDTLKVKTDVATGIVIPIGDYPVTKTTGKDCEGYPIYGLEAARNKLALCDVKMGKAPCMCEGEVVTEKCIVTAGDYVAVAVGTGKTVQEASKQAYKAVKSISIPSAVMVRDDIGERLEDDLETLKPHGYCGCWEY
ncbi:PurD Phosphoribosylamine-glycine ligase [uncultured Caudovirales phage]|uniref:phosphoribosylamine--glycine ligase n=1 Tax=uncultured Caudovirales phage TaxID=2100421 RepID=A0A6J5TAK9_9CAUD|nr:PurD Phosphoribosylamine-glycine ligase [uncultured Caudovirales phage]